MYASHYDHRLLFQCTYYNKMPSAYLIKINARYRTQEKYKMHFTSISKVTAVICNKTTSSYLPSSIPRPLPGSWWPLHHKYWKEDEWGPKPQEERKATGPPTSLCRNELWSIEIQNKPNSTYSTMTPCDMFGNCKQLNLFKHSSLQAIPIFVHLLKVKTLIIQVWLRSLQLLSLYFPTWAV